MMSTKLIITKFECFTLVFGIFCKYQSATNDKLQKNFCGILCRNHHTSLQEVKKKDVCFGTVYCQMFSSVTSIEQSLSGKNVKGFCCEKSCNWNFPAASR